MPYLRIPFTNLPNHKGIKEIKEILPPLSLDEGAFIAGGVILRMIQQKPLYTTNNETDNHIEFQTDIDIFTLDEETFSSVSEYIKRKKVVGYNEVRENFVKINTFFINHYPSYFSYNKSYKIQVIKNNMTNVYDLLKSFDFTVITIATDLTDCIIHKDTLSHIENNILHFKDDAPLNEQFAERLFKYMHKGFYPNGDIFEPLLKWHENNEIDSAWY